MLALTTADLWPGKGWNFVFGQASLKRGVGVWSLHRLGEPELEPETFLRRTAKIAVHEAGHMLGIWHCTQFTCGMNGANHQREADGQPMWFCPEDEMKIWWACRANPAERYRRLAKCRRHVRAEARGGILEEIGACGQRERLGLSSEH